MTLRAVSFAVLGLLVTGVTLLSAPSDQRYKPTSTEHAAMLRELDQLFGWAGVRRVSDLQRVDCAGSKGESSCTAKLFLEVDGRRRSYNIELEGSDRKPKFAAFYPDEPASPGEDSFDCERDTVKDPRLRALAVTAVERFNRHLRWHWVSGPMIQRVRGDFFVSYHTFSKEESKRVAYVYPTHATFFVTPRGTVCGAAFSE